MTCVNGVFLMNFDQDTLVIVNLLPESQCCLVRVDLFPVACSPAIPPDHIKPIQPTPIGQFFPLAEFSFILRPGAQVLSPYSILSRPRQSRRRPRRGKVVPGGSTDALTRHGRSTNPQARNPSKYAKKLIPPARQPAPPFPSLAMPRASPLPRDTLANDLWATGGIYGQTNMTFPVRPLSKSW
jgi:hypothetical protein